MANENNTAVVAIDKLVPAIEIYKQVFAENRERVDRALTVSKTIKLKDGQEILDEAQDKFANDFLNKARVTLESKDEKQIGIQVKRLASTKILDDAKAWAMVPEKELIAEMDRIKKLRDARANKLAEEAREKQKEIEMQKAYDTYRSKIKGDMQRSWMLGVADKVKGLEKTISDLFDSITLEKIGGLDKTLNFKPTLKEEYFDQLLTVQYDQNIMSVEQFDELKAAAKAYFDFAKVNAAYIDLATKAIAAWREKIPAKKLELEKIAKGGAEAAKAKAKADSERARLERERVIEEEKKFKEIDDAANETESKGALEAEFNAQIQTQSIEEPDGRTIRKFRIDPEVEKDFLKLANLIGKLALHALTEKDGTTQSNISAIYKRNKAGEIKLDDDGNPVYIDGIQDWLTMVGKIRYANDVFIPGIISVEKISTVASVKK